MNSKERLILALRREKPDRLPVTVHQWQQYHLVSETLDPDHFFDTPVENLKVYAEVARECVY